MSVTLNRNLPGKKSIAGADPWAGMGICLAVVVADVAYDVLAHAHSLAAGKSEGSTETKGDAEPTSSRSTVSLSESKLKEAEDHSP